MNFKKAIFTIIALNFIALNSIADCVSENQGLNCRTSVEIRKKYDRDAVEPFLLGIAVKCDSLHPNDPKKRGDCIGEILQNRNLPVLAEADSLNRKQFTACCYNRPKSKGRLQRIFGRGTQN